MRGPRMTLTVASLKMYLRNRGAVFFTLFIPLLIMAIFGVLNFGSSVAVRVGIVDQAHNPVSEVLISSLRQVPAVKLRTGDLEGERRALDRGDRDLVVVLPPSLGQAAAALPAYYNQGKPQEFQAALAIMTRFLDEASFRAAGTRPAFTVDAQPVKSRNLTYVDFLIPGIIAMSIMQLGIFGVAFSFVQLKQRGILRRLMATPMRVPDFIFAQVVSRLMVAALQVGLLLAVGFWLFHLHFVGNVFYLLLVGIVGAAIFIAIGFSISGIAKNEETAAPLTNLIAMPMMFLSGVFFPRGSMPDWLQGITQYLPLTFVADALRSISIDGSTLWAVRWDLVGMTVWLIISVFLATRLFRWEVS